MNGSIRRKLAEAKEPPTTIGEWQEMGPKRDPNAMDINREREGDRTCYVYRKWGYITKNYWKRYKGRVVETPQELAKENEGQ